MSTSHEPTKDENLYFIDHESGAEMTRLLDQDRLFTKAMGGLLPERSNDFSGLHRVLDLGCGPGGWVQEVAFANPEVEAVGVDISQQMIAYAQMQARMQGLHNAKFRVGDIQQPLDFPDNYFDLVNARLVAFLTPAMWPKFVRECVRIARPGGIIRLTESEAGTITNSAALEKMTAIFCQAMYRTGQSFSPTGRLLGITPMLSRLLRDAGCQNVQLRAEVIDFSAGTEAHVGLCKDTQVFFSLMHPFLIGLGLVTREEADQLSQQMELEMMKDDFCGEFLLFTAWGQKP